MNKETVVYLKEQQEELMTMKNKLSELQEQFNKDNNKLIESISIVSDAISETMQKVKEEALEEFGITGNKKLFGGIGIRETTKLKYNETDAIDFCKEKMPLFVKEILDKKGFEKLAKDSKDLDFVEINKVITATFPREIKL